MRGSIGLSYRVNEGSYLWRNKSKYGKENPDLPTKDESRGIALETLESLGLLPDEAYVSGTGGEQTES